MVVCTNGTVRVTKKKWKNMPTVHCGKKIKKMLGRSGTNGIAPQICKLGQSGINPVYQVICGIPD
jgi:hypothetical protein